MRWRRRERSGLSPRRRRRSASFGCARARPRGGGPHLRRLRGRHPGGQPARTVGELAQDGAQARAQRRLAVPGGPGQQRRIVVREAGGGQRVRCRKGCRGRARQLIQQASHDVVVGDRVAGVRGPERAGQDARRTRPPGTPRPGGSRHRASPAIPARRRSPGALRPDGSRVAPTRLPAPAPAGRAAPPQPAQETRAAPERPPDVPRRRRRRTDPPARRGLVVRPQPRRQAGRRGADRGVGVGQCLIGQARGVAVAQRAQRIQSRTAHFGLG